MASSPRPRLAVQVMLAISEGVPLVELSERFPELATVEGQAALGRAARILEESREDAWFMAELVEHIPEMIFVKEAASLRFVRFNGAAERLLGISRQEMLGKTDYDFFPAHEAEWFQAKDREVLREGKQLEIPEEEILTREGVRYLHTKKVPICDLDGTPRFLAGISRDITAYKAAQDQIARSQEDLRRLSARLQQAQEEERMRLSRELHDELGQVLTGLKIELTWIEEHVQEAQASLLGHLEQTQVMADSAMATVRRVATALRPQILDDLGLRAALDWLLHDACTRAHLQARLCYKVQQPPPKEIAITVFRICQEAVTNVVRHARARTVEVSVIQEEGALALRVTDDGAGFDPQSSEKNRLGLVGIRERVQLAKGDMALRTGLAEGTSLQVRLPLDRSALVTDEPPDE